MNYQLNDPALLSAAEFLVWVNDRKNRAAYQDAIERRANGDDPAVSPGERAAAREVLAALVTESKLAVVREKVQALTALLEKPDRQMAVAQQLAECQRLLAERAARSGKDRWKYSPLPGIPRPSVALRGHTQGRGE